MSRRQQTKGTPICHWCKEDLKRFPNTYSAIDPYDSPAPGVQGVGWLVCGPGCPERSETATVVQRGLVTA